jgi:methionine-rich copper-binding protein CopC
MSQCGMRQSSRSIALMRLEPGDPKLLSVGLPALAPGTYTVKYRVLSVDGHVVASQFSFTLRGSP